MGGTTALLGRWRADAGVLASLAVLVALTAGLVGAVPGLLDRLARESLEAAVDEARVDQVGLAATAVQPVRTQDAEMVSQTLAAAADELTEVIPAAVADVVGVPTSVVDTVRYDLTRLPDQPVDALSRKLTLRVQSGIEEELRVVEGSLPDGTTGSADVGLEGDLTVHRFAATREVADSLDLAVGEQRIATPDATGPLLARVPLRPTEPVVVELSAIVELTPVGDPVWFGDPRLHRASQFDTNTSTTIFGFGLVPLDAVAGLPGGSEGQLASVGVRWPLDREALLGADPGPVRDGALALRTSAPLRIDEPRWTTGLDRVLDGEAGRRAAAVEVLGLAAVGVLGVALTLIAGVAALLATRRQAGAALARGRGASHGQLRLAAVLESVAVVGVGTTLALAAVAMAVPSRTGAAVVLVVAAVSIVLLVRADTADLRRSLGAVLAERRRGRDGPRTRYALEGLVVVVAAVAVATLRRRGVTVDGTTDVLVVAAPVLLAVAVALIAARLIPLPLRAMAAASRRSRSLAVPLGLTRATRERTGGAVVVLLVLGLGVGGLATAVHGSLQAGQMRAAQEAVGADVRIDAGPFASLDPTWTPSDPDAAVAALTLLDGSLVTEIGAQRLDVLLVDPEELAALGGPALPDLTWDGIGATPVVLSSVLRTAGSPDVEDTVAVLLGVERIAARVTDIDPRVLGRDEEEDGPFVVLDRAAATAATGQELGVTTRLVRTSVPAVVAAEAAAAEPDADVAQRAVVEEALRTAPLARGVRAGFLVAALAVALATAVAVVLALAAAAPGRRRQAAVLAAVGTPTRSVRVAVLAEVVPTTLLAAIAGGSLAASIAVAVGDRLDLAPFTGTVDATVLTAPSFGIVVLAVLAATLLSAVAALVTLGRVDPGGLLREGDG